MSAADPVADERDGTELAVLFVCLGNHCRSPAAQAVAESLAASVTNVYFDSAGTSRAHIGEPPHPLSSAEGRRRGYSVTHRSRQVSAADFARFDLIIGMDDSNVRDLRRLRGSTDRRRHAIQIAEPDQLQLLRRWDPYGKPGDVQLDDPWGRGSAAYSAMYDVIERCIGPLIDHLAALTQGLSVRD
jgi:protein-tyrosine phosphatase